MELTILGSGLYMPVKGRVASGFYLKIKNIISFTKKKCYPLGRN